ncbi:hypothetical protein GCM10010210_53790 [Pseudonocardia hydrocarbonoxydans]
MLNRTSKAVGPRAGRTSRMVAVGAMTMALALMAASPAVAHEQAQGGTPSATDARWAAMMVAHHEGGIEITEIALEKSDNEGVRAVATESQQDQQNELPTLRAIAAAGGLEPMTPPAPLARFNEQDLQRLRALSGAEFDRAWLDVLSSHHMGAIMMTDVALAGTAGAPAEELQNQIRDGQLKQVARMNELREELHVD